MNRFVTAISLGVAAALAVGAGIASCGGSTTTPNNCAVTSNKPAACACTADIECARGLSCATAPAGMTGKTCQAVFVCTADSQCDATRNPVCTSAGACICLEGSCQQRGCSTDAVCEAGKICIGGKCDSRPASTGLTCNIVTPPSVVRQGQSVQFLATATNSNGAIVPGQTFTWASSNAAAAAVDASGVVTGGSTSGNTNITCRVSGGAAADSAAVAVTNYANPTAGTVRVVVVDETTGNPVAGATVVFRQAGADVAGSPKTTGADGIAEVTAAVTAATPVDAHVFKAGYTFVSVVGTTTTDLLLPLPPTPDTSKAGGFKGTFDLTQVSNQTDTVEFGLAGASLRGPFIDLDFTKLIGESIRKRVKIGNLYDDFLGLPSGLYLKLGDQNIKGDYAALAQAGKGHAWGLGGKVPFDKLIQVLTPVLGGGGTSNIPFGQIIAQVLPFFDKFRHFIKTDITVTETARVPDTGDINGDMRTDDLVADFNNATAFPTVNAKVTQALSLSTAVTVPDLPSYAGKFLEGAIVLAGANVAGRGLVPLGISAAVDAPKQGETADGKIDVDANTAGNQSTISFKMAPLHSGIEGSKYFVVTLALSLNFGSGSSLPASVSGIVTQPSQIGTTTDLGGQTFLAFPTTAAFNPTTRSFNLGTPVSGATFYRADYKGSDGDWVVYFKQPTAGDAFTLPAIPSGFTVDRAVRTSGCAGGAASCTNMRVFSLKTAASGGGSAPALDDMVAFGTVNLRRLNDFIGAFSNAQCQSSGSCAAPTN